MTEHEAIKHIVLNGKMYACVIIIIRFNGVSTLLQEMVEKHISIPAWL